MNYSVNLSSGQTVEVVIGEAAQINIEQALNYIESGRVEITKYVNEWAKPEITNYTKEYAEPIVTEIVNQTTKPLIDYYLNTTTKPQIDEYVADNVKPYADSAQDSAAKAKISEDNAKTSEINAKASELAAASSAGVASAAANDAKLWAVGTKTEKPEGSSKYWAEQAKNVAQIPDTTETVKGIVRLATSEEVTAGTNDSAAITPLKLKQKIAQDFTNPSANTVPSTKAVKDESSRITTLMDNKIGEITSFCETSLNGKMNKDASNITSTAKSTISGWSMPSSRYIDLTLGASGSTYTAPANGWFVFGRNATNPAGCELFNQTTGIGCSYVVERSWSMLSYVPAKKGDVVSIAYWQGNSTTIFRFIYAEGEQ